MQTSVARRGELSAELAGAADEAHRAYSALVGQIFMMSEADNGGRYARFVEWSGSELEAFEATIHSAVDDVNSWVGARLEWIAQLHDHAYREQLAQELTERRDSALLDL